MIASLPTSKRCSICGEVKPASEFYRQRERNGTERLGAYCKPCAHAYHRERLRVQYRTDPAYRERCLARERKRKRARSNEYQEGRVWTREHVSRTLDRLLASGWRQAEIARAIGVSRTTMSEWVRGTSTPRYHGQVQALRQFAEATSAGKIAPSGNKRSRSTEAT